MTTRLRLPLLALAGASALQSPDPMLAAAAPRPHIVYVHIDDLGWADLGCYGNVFHRTPAIDRLAQGALRFTQAYSGAPACTPSRVALVTGQHPARLHMTGQASFYRDPPNRKLLHPRTRLELPAGTPTFARALTQNGYTCVSFGKWGLGQHTGEHGFARVVDGDNDALTEMAVRFIRQPHQAPFLLYLNYHWIHSPLRPDPALAAANRERMRAAGVTRNPSYAAVMEQIDAAVERIETALDEANLVGDTMFIFTSDNGGFLGDETEPYTSNAPLREGKSSLYEGGIRVPFIVRWPGVTPAGAVCEAPFNNLDFFPTLGALLKLPPTGGTAFDGEDRSRLFRGEPVPRTRDMYWHFPHYRRSMAGLAASPSSAVRSGDWKLIHFYEDDHVEVYNLRDDPFEQRDLASARPDQAAILRRKLDDWRRAVDAQPPVPNPAYEFTGF